MVSEHSRVDLDLILGGMEPIEKKMQTFKPLQVLQVKVGGKSTEKQRHEHLEDNERSYSRVQTITLPHQPTKPISKDAMERFLRKWDTSLLRAKGFLNFAGKSQILLMQYATIE
jgi:G3E family GTPase